MVFSQTSHKTLSSLKIEIDPSELREQEDGRGRVGGVIGQGGTTLPPATTSCSEGYLKPEPLFEAKMFHDTDSEFFQDLVQWCSTPAKEEQVQTIDSHKGLDRKALNTDTLHTPFSPQGWEASGIISPHTQASFYTNTPKDPLSPSGEIPMQFIYSNEGNPQLQDQFLDIGSLPVVIGDLEPEKTVDINPWYMESVDFNNTHDTYYSKTSTQNNGPFIDQEDSLDMKLLSVIPREVESNDVVVSEYIINDHNREASVRQGRHKGLFLDVAARDPAWSGDVISTPDVLSFVEQLETENCKSSIKLSPVYEQDTVIDTRVSTPAAPEYEPITPQSHLESHHDSEEESKPIKKRRHDSEESDATYTPYIEETPRKYKRRKPNVPIKEMILALEGSQLTKARRGRPPKRRESTVSSACSIDETSSSVSTHEYKYRELRDKNNEASKRSRMHRKLKELQMEQLADELEERNKKLQIRANVLEDMTKKLKEALMTAILDKK